MVLGQDPPISLWSTVLRLLDTYMAVSGGTIFAYTLLAYINAILSAIIIVFSPLEMSSAMTVTAAVLAGRYAIIRIIHTVVTIFIFLSIWLVNVLVH